VFFGAGSNPRNGEKLSGWTKLTLASAHIARVRSPPYEEQKLFWPKELEEGATLYNPTIDIEYVKGPLGPLPLKAGVALSAKATDALYRAGVSHQAKLVSTRGSPVLSGLTRARRGSKQATTTSTSAASPSPPRIVAVESLRAHNAMVKSRPNTVATALESHLVHRYVDHLKAMGDEVGAILVPLPGKRAMRNDIFNCTRSALVEAKQAPTRENIRMAIGQILDYARSWDTKHRAVHLPNKPEADLLSLLDSVAIKAIWPDGAGFEDNAGGALV
jgi:hypothetical protein